LSDDQNKDRLEAPGNYSFGELNPMFRGIVREVYDSDKNPIDYLKKSIIDYLSPQKLKSVGPFKAVVLRVEPKTTSPNSSPDSVNSPSGSTGPDLVRIKARIPEMHSALPIPEQFGHIDGPHQSTIDLYHTFTAQSDAVPEPTPGELVWVDFVDKVSMLGGIYVRPISERESLISTIVDKVSALGIFQGQPCGNYNNNSPSNVASGDSMPAARSNSGLSGLPQTSRLIEPTGENKVIEGQGGASKAVIDKWMSGASKAGIRGSKNHFFRPQSNRGHHVIVHVPGTSILEEPIEVAYFFHGAGSWNKQTLFDALPAQAKEMGSSQRRNIVTVFVENRPASGKPGYFDPGGGSFSALQADVEQAIQTFGAATIAYRSITVHSMGGRSMSRAIKQNHINNINKFTAADIIAAEQVWPNMETHIRQRNFPLELNIFGVNTSKPISEDSHEKILKGMWESLRDDATETSFFPSDFKGEYNSGKGERTMRIKLGGDRSPVHTITRVNLGLGSGGHTQYGLRTYTYINPHKPPAGGPPKKENLPPDFKKWKRTANGSIYGWEDTSGTTHRGIPQGMQPPEGKADPKALEEQPQSSTKQSTTEKCADAPANNEAELQRIQEQIQQAQNSENHELVVQLQAQLEQTQQNFAESPCVEQAQTCNQVASKFCSLIEPPAKYKESRVRLVNKGGGFRKTRLSDRGSDGQPLLVEIPPTLKAKRRTERLHRLAFARFQALNRAWQQETGKSPLLLGNGWRKPKTVSEQQWVASLCCGPGKEYSSERQLRKYRAYNSPHETGLAMDFQSHGLEATRKTIEKQKQTEAFIWLQNNAHRFGITPYIAEPWHWEVNVPIEAYESGEEFVLNNNFAVRVQGQGRQGAVSNQTGIAHTGPGGTGAPCGIMGTIGDFGVTGAPSSTPSTGGGKINPTPRNDSKFASGGPPCASSKQQLKEIVGSNSPINFNDAVFGIDVHPTYQNPGPIDYGQVREAGASFVIINTTQGDSTKGRDNLFKLHYTKAKNAGLLVGTYHFAYPGPNDARAEAQAHLRTIDSLGGPIDICPFLDLEQSGFREGIPTDQAIADWIDEWFEIVKQRMGKVGGYIGRNSLQRLGIPCYVPRLGSDVPHWHANYPKTGVHTLSLDAPAIRFGRENPWTFNRTPQWPTTMWQYAGSKGSQGQVPGLTDKLGATTQDLNITDTKGLNKMKL
jgi:GH25 family lysozyme M1 (1,4-beta-N-acetylmuramidase)